MALPLRYTQKRLWYKIHSVSVKQLEVRPFHTLNYFSQTLQLLQVDKISSILVFPHLLFYNTCRYWSILTPLSDLKIRRMRIKGKFQEVSKLL